MTKNNESNRVFLISEASYNNRVEHLATMCQIVKAVISMTRNTGELAMNGKGVKQSFKWLLHHCDQMDALADKILTDADIPYEYVRSRDTRYLDRRKAKEVYIEGEVCADEENDDAENDIDAAGEFYDAGYIDGIEDKDYPELTDNDLEKLVDSVYELKEEASDCIAQFSEIIKSADALIDSLNEIVYRLNS